MGCKVQLSRIFQSKPMVLLSLGSLVSRKAESRAVAAMKTKGDSSCKSLRLPMNKMNREGKKLLNITLNENRSSLCLIVYIQVVRGYTQVRATPVKKVNTTRHTIRNSPEQITIEIRNRAIEQQIIVFFFPNMGICRSLPPIRYEALSDIRLRQVTVWTEDLLSWQYLIRNSGRQNTRQLQMQKKTHHWKYTFTVSLQSEGLNNSRNPEQILDFYVIISFWLSWLICSSRVFVSSTSNSYPSPANCFMNLRASLPSVCFPVSMRYLGDQGMYQYTIIALIAVMTMYETLMASCPVKCLKAHVGNIPPSGQTKNATPKLNPLISNEEHSVMMQGTWDVYIPWQIPIRNLSAQIRGRDGPIAMQNAVPMLTLIAVRIACFLTYLFIIDDVRSPPIMYPSWLMLTRRNNSVPSMLNCLFMMGTVREIVIFSTPAERQMAQVESRILELQGDWVKKCQRRESMDISCYKLIKKFSF